MLSHEGVKLLDGVRRLGRCGLVGESMSLGEWALRFQKPISDPVSPSYIPYPSLSISACQSGYGFNCFSSTLPAVPAAMLPAIVIMD